MLEAVVIREGLLDLANSHRSIQVIQTVLSQVLVWWMMVHGRLASNWDSCIANKIRVQLELLILSHGTVASANIVAANTLWAGGAHLEGVEWLIARVDSDPVTYKVAWQQRALVQIASSLSNILISAGVELDHHRRIHLGSVHLTLHSED